MSEGSTYRRDRGSFHQADEIESAEKDARLPVPILW
jgi:hypothetical protein